MSPPGRRSETLGDLIENYNFELQLGGKHAKEKADAWAKAEAEEVVTKSPYRHVLYCFRVGRKLVRIATWVVRIAGWLVFWH